MMCRSRPSGATPSIWNDDDDEPLTWIGLFNSDAVDKGVADSVGLANGGHVLQVTTDLGGGVSLSGGLENLNGTETSLAGTAIGVSASAGDGIDDAESVEEDVDDVDDQEQHPGVVGDRPEPLSAATAL